jgi:DUF4097 and DUF4098 domain-containing protein YvlB
MLTSVLGLIAATALAAPVARGADFQWHGRLADGRSLEIKGVNGDVRASAATGGEIEVSARKHGKRSNPDEVEIKVLEHEGGVTICAVYPSSGSRPNECAPGSQGRMNSNNNDVSVEFEVKLPAGVRFVGRTVNGSVEATNLPSHAEAYTVNGSIDVTAGGEVQAETVNGAITASLGKTNGSEPLTFKTVNGSIRIGLPAGTNADVQAKTLNGEISSDFPLTVQGRIGRHVKGTLGSGGRPLRLETVNGSIELRKGA